VIVLPNRKHAKNVFRDRALCKTYTSAVRHCALHAYEVQGARLAVQQAVKVIVRKALDTRTPLIHASMHRIEFNPHWNVPTSIAQNELVPKLRREPPCWEQLGFEFVNPRGVVNPATRRLMRVKVGGVVAGKLGLAPKDTLATHHTPRTPPHRTHWLVARGGAGCQ
jgi:L,D-transpeptidase catalytic domain